MTHDANRVVNLTAIATVETTPESWKARPQKAQETRKRGRQNTKHKGLKMVILVILTIEYYFLTMATLVTTKGQVTIPKKLRDRYGIRPGVRIDFVASPDGIHLRKVVKKEAGAALGCLRRELTGRKVSALLDDLRGEVDLPQKRHR